MALGSLGSLATVSDVGELAIDMESCDVSQQSLLPLEVRVAQFWAGLDDCCSSDCASVDKTNPVTIAGVKGVGGHTPNTTVGLRFVSEAPDARKHLCRSVEQSEKVSCLHGTKLPSGVAASKEISVGHKPRGASPKRSQEQGIVNNMNFVTPCGASVPGSLQNLIPRQSPRRRRYRNQQQKLSNSLAQKRYRERKKEAFKHLETVVDHLSSELKSLQGVRAENEKLLQMLASLGCVVGYQEDQRQLSSSQHCATIVGPSAQYDPSPHRFQLDGVVPVHTSVSFSDTQMPSHKKLRQTQCQREEDLTRGTGSDCQAIGANSENMLLCTAQLAGLSSGDTIAVLENEWDRGMSNLAKLIDHRASERGPVSQGEQAMLDTITTRLCKANSRMMLCRIQQAVDENRSNSQKMKELSQAFLDFHDRDPSENV